MQAFEAARGAGDGANGDANGGSGIQRTSDVAQAIGEAILQHDPVDRKRLARLKSLLCSEYCRVNILVNTDFSE